jgi:V-type H+-transporting ATPase subunit H
MANAQDASPATEHSLPLILSYLCGLAKNSNDAGLQDIAVTQYSSLLYSQTNRRLFWKQRSETVAPLIDILQKAAGFGAESSASLWSGTSAPRSGGSEGLSGGIGLQLLYHVLLVLWQLSFEAEDIGDDMNEYGKAQAADCVWLTQH